VRENESGQSVNGCLYGIFSPIIKEIEWCRLSFGGRNTRRRERFVFLSRGCVS